MSDDTLHREDSTDTEQPDEPADRPTGADDRTRWDRDIQIGDVVLDLAQGRPMQVVDRAADSVAIWERANDYDLTGNYGNSRLGATAEDAVFTCVYTGSIKSEPSKTYDFPESRLARIETEAAHGEIVQETFAIELLADMVEAAADWDEDGMAAKVTLAANHAGVPNKVVNAAGELAAARTGYAFVDDGQDSAPDGHRLEDAAPAEAPDGPADEDGPILLEDETDE